MRRFYILLLICVFGFAFCFTNGFADKFGGFADEAGGFADDNFIPVENFEFPAADGAAYIQGTPEFQRVPENIIDTNDFEKMRDLPTDSQDYILSTKVGMILIPSRFDPRRGWVCTGFLIGPDLFMTAHHCIHDEFGLRSIEGAAILMDYYQESAVDPTRGGVTARVTELLRADATKDYALLRLDKPIGNTYGWLELDTETRVNSSQSVKLISHPDGRSKEIVRRNTEIMDIPAGHPLTTVPFTLIYLADTERGSSGSPVFLREGTGVIAIHHSGWTFRGEPSFNAGTLMSYIVPEIRPWLPGNTTPDLVVEAPRVPKDWLRPGEFFTVSATVRNLGGVDSSATTLRFYESSDSSITTSDVEIGTAVVGSLGPFEASEVSMTFTASVSEGSSFYGACVDAVADEELTDNNCSTGVYVTVSTAPPVYMYWADWSRDKIQRATLNGTHVADLIVGLPHPLAIAVDVDGEQMYWTDFREKTIQRANLDGSNVQTLVTGLNIPLALALDAEGGHIYWTDSGARSIQRADLNGFNVQTVVTGLAGPAGLALDIAGRKMYWTDWSDATDRIQRANLDGSNIETLIPTGSGLSTPIGLTLDIAGEKMYWTDANPNRIQRANLDGSNVQTLVSGEPTVHIALDPDAEKMYWAAQVPGRIQRANLDGSNVETLVTGLDRPFGIALGISPVIPSPPSGEPPIKDDSLDVNGDGQVNVIDLAIVALFYGTRVPAGMDFASDVNDDGTVNLSDLIAVTEAIDAAGNSSTLSADDVEVVLEAVAEQANAIEEVAEAPAHFSTSQQARFSGIAYRNVAAAFEAAKHRATDDARLGKWMPLFRELLHRLSEMREIPDTTALLVNYPNPFNPETWIPYHLATDAAVTLTIYDVGGSVVRTLKIGHQPAGVYQSKHRAAYWDGKNQLGEKVASGLYFYTLSTESTRDSVTAGEFTATRKMLIAK